MIDKKVINYDIDYVTLNKQVETLSCGINYDITILANVSALLYEQLPDLNWCGFYLLKDDVLLLGPFQGKTACTIIEIGKGVCGTCVQEDETQVVSNVHEFKGHIACDGASNSEIVIPIHIGNKIYGVLDIDSPCFDRFSNKDKEGLEIIVKTIEKYLN